MNTDNFIIRPVKESDLKEILRLSEEATFGLTTLPTDKELLQQRIKRSISSFASAERPGMHSFLFVLEDLKEKKLAGTTGIASKTGGFEPFYAYKIMTTTRSSPSLNITKRNKALHLYTEHNGPSEIGTLFLSPEYRGLKLGPFLSRSRFLFIASNPHLFDKDIIAELRGVIDENGQSPFWEAIGRHFFNMELPTADYLSMKNKQCIADLMPLHPIYISLLPKEAKKVIGKVHNKTKGALKMLEEEGFKKTKLVDIFEAGPVVKCPKEQIKTVRHSKTFSIESINATPPKGKLHIIASQKNFCMCLGYIQKSGKKAQISAQTAKILKLKQGDKISCVIK